MATKAGWPRWVQAGVLRVLTTRVRVQNPVIWFLDLFPDWLLKRRHLGESPAWRQVERRTPKEAVDRSGCENPRPAVHPSPRLFGMILRRPGALFAPAMGMIAVSTFLLLAGSQLCLISGITGRSEAISSHGESCAIENGSRGTTITAACPKRRSGEDGLTSGVRVTPMGQTRNLSGGHSDRLPETRSVDSDREYLNTLTEEMRNRCLHWPRQVKALRSLIAQLEMEPVRICLRAPDVLSGHRNDPRLSVEGIVPSGEALMAPLRSSSLTVKKCSDTWIEVAGAKKLQRSIEVTCP